MVAPDDPRRELSMQQLNRPSPGGAPAKPSSADPSFNAGRSRSSLQPGTHYADRPTHSVHFAQPTFKDYLLDLRAYLSRSKRNFKRETAGFGVLDWLGYFLPIVNWLRTYKIKEYLLWDALAGISVAALVVPQGMAYAKLAGLPSVYGLYGAFTPVMLYAALGSSRHLAVGPVAVTSLLLGDRLPHIIDEPVQTDPNNPTNEHAQTVYNHAAIQVALIAGLIYTGVGIFKLGWVTNYLSHSVIAGFATGASVIIGLSQVKTIFGYTTRPNPASTPHHKLPAISFPRHDPVQEQLGDLFGHDWTPYFKWREFVMGVCWIILLITMKQLGKRGGRWIYLKAAGPLTVVVLSIAIMNIFKLYKPPYNIKPVGHIPKGLPHETVSWWFPIHKPGEVIGLAVVICLVDVLESISIAKTLAYRNNYKLLPTQELRGLGLANLLGSAFNCYTTTGSFSRSAVMNEVGARTQLAGIISALLVMIVLLILTPVFKNMAQNAQAAIVISAVIGLFNWQEFFFLWKVNKFDWLVFCAAVLGVLLAGVEIGLAIAIGLSIGIVLLKSGFPHTATLGRLPGTTVYRNVKQYPEAEQLEGILMVRVDAPMYFANVNPVSDHLVKYEERAELQAAAAGKRAVQFIIIDLSPVTDIDGSAVHYLQGYIKDHKARGVQVVFANPSRQVVRCLETSGLPQIMDPKFVLVRMQDAVQLCQELIAEGGPAKATRRLSDFASPTNKISPSSSSSGDAGKRVEPEKQDEPRREEATGLGDGMAAQGLRPLS